MEETIKHLAKISVAELNSELKMQPDIAIHKVLEFIVYKDKKYLLDKFIKAGIDPNIRLLHKNGMSLLHVAAFHKSYSCAEYLIKIKAEINACDDDNETPLINAGVEADAKMARLLLSAGADPFVRSVAGFYIDYFFKNNEKMKADINKYKSEFLKKNTDSIVKIYKDDDTEAFRKIFNPDEINKLDSYNKTYLHYAAFYGALSIMKFLIDNKAAIDIENTGGITPLHFAVSEGSVQCVQLLLHNGANVHHKTSNGVTVFDYLGTKDNDEVHRMLSIYGASVSDILSDNVLNEIVGDNMKDFAFYRAQIPLQSFFANIEKSIGKELTSEIISELGNKLVTINSQESAGEFISKAYSVMEKYPPAAPIVDHFIKMIPKEYQLTNKLINENDNQSVNNTNKENIMTSPYSLDDIEDYENYNSRIRELEEKLRYERLEKNIELIEKNKNISLQNIQILEQTMLIDQLNKMINMLEKRISSTEQENKGKQDLLTSEQHKLLKKVTEEKEKVIDELKEKIHSSTEEINKLQENYQVFQSVLEKEKEDIANENKILLSKLAMLEWHNSELNNAINSGNVNADQFEFQIDLKSNLLPLFKCFTPNNEYIKDSLKKFAELFENSSNLARYIIEINNGSIKNYSVVQAIEGWKELHYNTGYDDSGRIYFKTDNQKNLVLISNKKNQKEDLRYLKWSIG